MSTLLEQASLVMIPSGYKEDIVYSQIPTSGAGDLSFTRASNGTRIDSNGNVEVVPWNLLSNSEEFTTGNGWFANTTGGSTATQTSNYGVAPNGTTTADRIQLALNGQAYADWVQVPTTGIIVGQVYTYSIYIKSLSGTKTILFFNDSTVNVLKTITTEWVRYEYSWTATSATIYPRFLIDGGTSSSADLLAWGYQINIGSTAKPYFPTTDRLNVPRLTYQNGGGGCPSLLLEKQSTNDLSYSEEFDNAAWSVKDNLSVTANATTSPDGTQNADKLVENSSNDQHRVYRSADGTNKMFSFFAKASERSWVSVLCNNGNFTWFDLANGQVGTVAATSTATIENVGNGWYRCAVYNTHGSFGSLIQIATANNVTSYQGNGTSGIFVWGAQLEASSYATSYIPTTSSSATRVADACYKTGISSLIGQTSGSVFFDFTVDTISAQTNSPVLCYMKDGGAGERYIELYANGNLEYLEYDGSSIIARIIKTGLTIGRHKCAIAYATNDFVFYVDGVQIGTDTSGTPNGYSTFAFQYYNSTYYGQQQVNQCALFKTRLTNSELAQITGNQNYTINQAYESYGVASESPNCVQP